MKILCVVQRFSPAIGGAEKIAERSGGVRQMNECTSLITGTIIYRSFEIELESRES